MAQQLKKIISRNPVTNEVFREFPVIQKDDLIKKIERAHDAFKLQKKLSNSQRCAKLERLGNLLDGNAEKYAKLITAEMGKPISQSILEVKKSANHCRFYAKNADKFLSPDRVKTEAKKSMVEYEPLGVIYQMIPFNFPIFLTFKSGVPALLIGNSILHRNSNSTPMCGLAMEELMVEAGYDAGEFQNVFTEHDQLETIISHRYVQGVSFTGSTKAGSAIGSMAGKYMKRSVLELGGNDPFIVLDDADIELATNLAMTGRLSNAGQVCLASKRFIVDEKLFDSFKDKLIHKCKTYKVGDPLDPNTQMGPMARQDLLENIQKQIEKGVSSGAELLFGGKRLEEEIFKKGYFMEPTVLEVEETNPLLKEETFGPVFALIKAKDENDCIRIANNTDYGLGAVIVTRDSARGEKVGKQIESGSVFVNENMKSDSRLPSGGVKQSGYGRECGEFGVKEFCNPKTVWIN